MCDFAHDPEEVRKLLVGRVLTVERVRQLNAKDYVPAGSAGLRDQEGRRSDHARG